jgi:hypothetical protein
MDRNAQLLSAANPGAEVMVKVAVAGGTGRIGR